MRKVPSFLLDIIYGQKVFPNKYIFFKSDFSLTMANKFYNSLHWVVKLLVIENEVLKY